MNKRSHGTVTDGGSAQVSNGAADAFADARVMYTMALARLDASDIRDAAEKAWCATKRAADGLIIARTGTVPSKSPDTTRMLRELTIGDQQVQTLLQRCCTARDLLHGDCFYSGMCDPLVNTLSLIRGTDTFITDAEHLADR